MFKLPGAGKETLDNMDTWIQHGGNTWWPLTQNICPHSNSTPESLWTLCRCKGLWWASQSWQSTADRGPGPPPSPAGHRFRAFPLFSVSLDQLLSPFQNVELLMPPLPRGHANCTAQALGSVMPTQALLGRFLTEAEFSERFPTNVCTWTVNILVG